MKKSTRFIVSLAVVFLLALTAVSVWASPNRVGTVPILPDEMSGTLMETINFGTGTVSVEASSSEGGTLTISKVADPVTVIGAFPEGWVALLDEALEVTVIDGATTSVKICVPQSPDMESRSPTFHYWDATTKIWSAIPTEVTTGNPPMVCGTGSAEGKYALLGQ